MSNDLQIATGTMLMPCDVCKQTDIILKENAKTWCCPFCYFTNIQQNNVLRDVERINRMSAKVDELNLKVEDNMKRLNQMMLELKGIVAMVRPQVKKSGWYGDELKADAKQEAISFEIKQIE